MTDVQATESSAASTEAPAILFLSHASLPCDSPPSGSPLVQIKRELQKQRPDPFILSVLCRSMLVPESFSSDGDTFEFDNAVSIPDELRPSLYIALLGVRYNDRAYLELSIARVEEDLENQKVIQADAARTRTRDSLFRDRSCTDKMSRVLTYYCKENNVRYKQGMNEVLAPFIMLQNDEKECEFTDGILYQSYHAMIERFLPNMYRDEEFRSLQQAFHLYRLLLLYHDPELCLFLDEHDMSPEVYVTPWFLTLFARNLDRAVLFSLWDFILIHNNQTLMHFVTVALVMEHRKNIFETEKASLPETLSNIAFQSVAHVARVCVLAKALMEDRTPKLFEKELLLACYDIKYPQLLPLSLCLRISCQELVESCDDADELKFIVLDCRQLSEFVECHFVSSVHTGLGLELEAQEYHVCVLGPSLPTEATLTGRLGFTTRVGSSFPRFKPLRQAPKEEEDTYVEHPRVLETVRMLLEKKHKYVSVLDGGFEALKSYIDTLDVKYRQRLLATKAGTNACIPSPEVLKSRSKSYENVYLEKKYPSPERSRPVQRAFSQSMQRFSSAVGNQHARARRHSSWMGPTEIRVKSCFDIQFFSGPLGILFQRTGFESKFAATVESLVPESQASSCRKLMPGDTLIAVNDESLSDVSFRDTIEKLRNTNRPMTLRFDRTESKKKTITGLERELLMAPPVLVRASLHSLSIAWPKIATSNVRYALQYAYLADEFAGSWISVRMKDNEASISNGTLPGCTQSSCEYTNKSFGTFAGLEPNQAFIFRVRCSDNPSPYSSPSAVMRTLLHENGEERSCEKVDALRLQKRAVFIAGENPDLIETGVFYFRVLRGIHARSSPAANATKLELVLQEGSILKCSERYFAPETSQIFVKLWQDTLSSDRNTRSSEDDMSAWAFENAVDGSLVLERLTEDAALESACDPSSSRVSIEDNFQQHARTFASIFSSNGHGPGTDNETHAIRTLSPPQILQVFTISSTALAITWNPINDLGITKYQIQYAKNRIASLWRSLKITVPVDTLKYEITNLQPDTMYLLRIRGGNDQYWGPYSSTTARCRTLSETEWYTHDTVLPDAMYDSDDTLSMIRNRRGSLLVNTAAAIASRLPWSSVPKQTELGTPVENECTYPNPISELTCNQLVNLAQWKLYILHHEEKSTHFFSAELAEPTPIQYEIFMTQGRLLILLEDETIAPGLASVVYNQSLDELEISADVTSPGMLQFTFTV